MHQSRLGLSIIKPGWFGKENAALIFFSGQDKTKVAGGILVSPVYFCSFTSPMPTIFAEVRNFL